MYLVFNNQRVAKSFKSLKTKMKQSKSPVTNDSIIERVVGGKTVAKFKVVTSLYKGKKNSYTNVRFKLV